MNAHIVLGLGFGDEGKGITTDLLCSHLEHPIVIRFSGGQQAGHTVIKDGVKHVHSNFGSGTLRGVPSYFTEHTSIYLNTIAKEKKVLEEKGIIPKLYIHPLAKVTTPYDVAYNRWLEKQKEHGSCGLGIAATMLRNQNTGYKLHAVDLNFPQIALAKLDRIKHYYVNLIPFGSDFGYFTEQYEKSEEEFIQNIYKANKLISTVNYDFLNGYENLIFEGSQGIMLDMDHGIFPNVTFANTTSKNAWEVIEKYTHVNKVETYYVTRCYQTRHGNGWMSNKNKIELINNHEEINKFNEWQKEFKVAELDYELLNYALEVDAIYNKGMKHLVVTCLDQRPGFKFDYSRIYRRWEIDSRLESYSPESKDIEVLADSF